MAGESTIRAPRCASLRVATQLNAPTLPQPVRRQRDGRGTDYPRRPAAHRIAPLRRASHRNAYPQGTHDMQASVATLTLVGLTPYSQSRQHDDPKLEGESHDAFDARTWRSKLNVATRNGAATIVLPAHGLQQSIAAAAKYSKRQIPGQGKATWTKKFEAGIALLEDPALNIDPASVSSITISANADGIRGSGRRVQRRFPIMPEWRATFDIYILDPIITEPVFREMVEIAGMFIGIGRFRPEKGGTNGRFKIEALAWADNRKLAA
jgi:hypothetical protein